MFAHCLTDWMPVLLSFYSDQIHNWIGRIATKRVGFHCFNLFIINSFRGYEVNVWALEHHSSRAEQWPLRPLSATQSATNRLTTELHFQIILMIALTLLKIYELSVLKQRWDDRQKWAPGQRWLSCWPISEWLHRLIDTNYGSKVEHPIKHFSRFYGLIKI